MGNPSPLSTQSKGSGSGLQRRNVGVSAAALGHSFFTYFLGALGQLRRPKSAQASLWSYE